MFSDLLTNTFILLLVAWAALVTPHVLFQDFFLEGKMYNLGDVCWARTEVIYYGSDIKKLYQRTEAPEVSYKQIDDFFIVQKSSDKKSNTM